MRRREIRTLGVTLGVLLLLLLGVQWSYPTLFESYTGVVNLSLDYESSQPLSDEAFDAVAQALVEARCCSGEGKSDPRQSRLLANTPSILQRSDLKHIQYFRDAGIRQYRGPESCLQCHQTMQVHHADGSSETVNTLDDVVDSVHFTFQSSSSGFTTYGYDGKQVNGAGERSIPVGKINRACGIPGSFSWTGWAELIRSRPHGTGEEVIRSEGCGQCHIGGNYHPATEKMMPGGDVVVEAKEGIDCLICHAAEYDMNQRYVIEDEHGMRWNQDRSMRAALSVGEASVEYCLRCHQHNMGGDYYRDNVAARSLGHKNQRLLHRGAKRGNPYSPADDVHAAAGLGCTDCHQPEGHKIPRGRLGVDLVANDLPGKAVSCLSCHTTTPHIQSPQQAMLNGHIDKLACESCHITHLEPNSVVLRDWVHPTWNEEEGIYLPTDIYLSGEVGKGFTFLWLNGNGTFLANALGSHPTQSERYNPLMQQMAQIDNPEVVAEIRTQVEALKRHYPEIDVERYLQAATRPLTQLSPEMLEQRARVVEENLRPVMNLGKSKIYPFRLFNAMMYEDMGNQGPFGAMILPFDYPTYYETGDTVASVKEAIRNPIVKRMYETPFKLYMMDRFMRYFGVEEGWKTEYPLVDGELINVEPRWMRQMGTLMVNHGIEKRGRSCRACHAEDGVMDFRQLGYTPERVSELTELPETWMR